MPRLGPERPPHSCPIGGLGHARGRGSPSPTGQALRNGAVAMKGLNGRGWRGGPGPRLSAEHHLEMALLRVARLKGGRGGLLGTGWWKGVKTLIWDLRFFAS